jgi:hypothetical protein
MKGNFGFDFGFICNRKSVLVEADEKHHFKPRTQSQMNIERFERDQLRDKEKDRLCQEHVVLLIKSPTPFKVQR